MRIPSPPPPPNTHQFSPPPQRRVRTPPIPDSLNTLTDPALRLNKCITHTHMCVHTYIYIYTHSKSYRSKGHGKPNPTCPLAWTSGSGRRRGRFPSAPLRRHLLLPDWRRPFPQLGRTSLASDPGAACKSTTEQSWVRLTQTGLKIRRFIYRKFTSSVRVREREGAWQKVTDSVSKQPSN